MFCFKRPVGLRLIALFAGLLLCLTGCAARTPADSSSDASAESDVNPYAFREIGRCSTGNSRQYLFDRDAILFVENYRTLCRANTDGTKKTVLFTAPRATMDYGFTLGGKHLFFWNDYNGTDAQFYSVSLEGGDAREIHWDGYSADDIFFYADGRLYFIASRDGENTDILCSSLPDGSDIREIYGQNDRLLIYLNRLTPDGFIVFSFTAFATADDPQLAQIRPDGSGFALRDSAADAYRMAFTQKDKMLYTALFDRLTNNPTEQTCISRYKTKAVLNYPVDGWVYAVQERGEEANPTDVLVAIREDSRDPHVILALDSAEYSVDSVDGILSVVNDTVYYTLVSEDYSVHQLWSVHTDGSHSQKVMEYHGIHG